MIYFVCRPINLWLIDEKQFIEIRCLNETPKLSCVSNEFPEENKSYINPIDALNSAIKLRNKIEKLLTIRIIKNEEVIIKSRKFDKLFHWANKEYSSLKKCKLCANIVYNTDYCSIKCEKQNVLELEDETEFYL